MRVCRCVATDGRALGTRVKAEGNFRQASERFSYMRALTAYSARLSSRQLAFTRARVHASARSGSSESCSADGSDSCDLFAAESNAQPAHLVAQLARVDARIVLTPYECFQDVRARLTRSGVMTESGH